MTASEAYASFLQALRADDPQRLYDLAPCGYLSTAPDGTIVKANQTFLTLCGYDAAELVGRLRFDQLLTPGGRIYHETHYAPMLHMQGSAREIALELARPDGQRRSVLVNAVLDRGPDGEPVAVRLAVFDAAERRSYERELLAAKRRAEESDARARALVRTLQQALLPPEPPVIEGLEVAARFLPAETELEIGGDFYDVFPVGDDEWVLAVGDVCGKGVEAAVVTALARFTIRAEAIRNHRPADALQVLNQVLAGYHAHRFCTVVLVRLSRRGRGWSGLLTCAGHPLPLLRRANGRIEALGRPGTLLGVVAEPPLHDVAFELAPGEALVLFTDGVLEARREDQFYGDDRAAVALAHAPGTAVGLADALERDVLAFAGDQRGDDIAILAVAAAPAAATAEAPSEGSRGEPAS